ncbi:hypothetical protein F2Q69_00021370 [Brassica cretica]|uniref:Uncharacterized protein n=1 Tax=Brassica cretica TaxID=69181 RepID=A0A8S9Q301_BRACR|nr:hypothetical protein F2Q69_00021370 [Brassica cretica]
MGRSSLPLNFHETASPHTLAFKAALAIESEVRSSPFFPHHLRVFPGSRGGFGCGRKLWRAYKATEPSSVWEPEFTPSILMNKYGGKPRKPDFP